MVLVLYGRRPARAIPCTFEQANPLRGSRTEPQTLKVSAVNELEQRIFSDKREERTAENGLERRREPRIQVDRLVYVQAADSQVGHFEEVRSMRDLSRSGFYFTTERGSYQPGNRLHVVPAFGCLNLEYLGEVVRVEQLPLGEFGVAVRLLRVENMKATGRSATLSAFEAFSRVDSEPVAEPECEVVGS